jgi:DNA-binding IscR family transcriptional regulator
MEQRACEEGAPCAAHGAWEEGQRAILERLGAQTLSDFVAEE